MLINCLKVELYKYKRSPVLIAHLVIPVVVSLIFIAYYSVSPWSDKDKIVAFYQALGIAFPVLIGIFTASEVEKELGAGHFQNLLTYKSKVVALLSKVVVLLILGLSALMLTTLIFGILFSNVLGMGGEAVAEYGHNAIVTYVIAAFVIWLAGIPFYFWTQILALSFGKGLAIGFGIFSSILTGVFLTGIGSLVWRVVPFSWTGRMVNAYFEHDLMSVIFIYFVVTIVSVLCYAIFALRYEGNSASE